MDRRKFSGNAQRRRRRFLLFHGTFLLDFPIPLVEELLPYPPKAPPYRRRRRHGAFLTNLRQPPARIKALLMGSWNAALGGDVRDPARSHRLAGGTEVFGAELEREVVTDCPHPDGLPEGDS